MNTVLRVLLQGGDEKQALAESFEAAARGFGAEKALLLLVEQQEPMRLRSAWSSGLADKQVRACEHGESVKGVSSSVIRSVLSGRRPKLIENPYLVADADATPALTGENYSVLCAPVLDPVQDTVVAVTYFQTSGEPYRASDVVWIDGYAAAIGQAFALHFQEQASERQLREVLLATERPDNAPDLIGDSAHTQALRRVLHEVYIPAMEAPDPDPLLILGEKGTGKDLVARYIHAYSARRSRPFVAVNCAEISDELAAARFFGHKKGAFSSAVRDEPGFFRAAHRGVLFLDEIAELSPRAQGTLLRVLENRTVVPVGETRELRVDVQVLLATNRDLESAVAEGAIKPDILDRFRTQAIRLEPLRERPWDIGALARHFLSFHERRTGKKTLGFTPGAVRALVSHSWPGNVRELARVCSLLVTHARPGARVDEALLTACYPDVARGAPNPRAAPVLWEDVSMREAVRAFKRELILSRLERHNWNVRAVRESMRLPKTTFHRYAVRLGITPPSPGGKGPLIEES